jgi:hypothetical protein
MDRGVLALIFAFHMYPFVINTYLSFTWRTPVGQWLVLVTSLLYATWFGLAFVHWRHAPGIAFSFVGLPAWPVLMILWAVAGDRERRARAA